MTDKDQQIRSADMPERFQLRRIPVSPTEEGELDEEAEWIYKYVSDTRMALWYISGFSRLHFTISFFINLRPGIKFLSRLGKS